MKSLWKSIRHFIWLYFSGDVRATFEKAGIKEPSEIEVRMLTFATECKGLVTKGFISEEEFSWLTILFAFDILGKREK